MKMGEEVEVLVKSAENGRLTLCMPKAREVPEVPPGRSVSWMGSCGELDG